MEHMQENFYCILCRCHINFLNKFFSLLLYLPIYLFIFMKYCNRLFELDFKLETKYRNDFQFKSQQRFYSFRMNEKRKNHFGFSFKITKRIKDERLTWIIFVMSKLGEMCCTHLFQPVSKSFAKVVNLCVVTNGVHFSDWEVSFNS